MEISVIILAAGHGTRMRSSLPKVLHRVAGKPMIRHAIGAAKEVSLHKPVVVVGHGADELRKELGADVDCVLQDPQLGTAHAVQTVEPLLAGWVNLAVVMYADMPLITGATLKRLVEMQLAQPGAFTLLTLESDQPRGFGRIVRNADGKVQEIVEEAQATPEQLSIKELNVGAYCFDCSWLWPALKQVQRSPKGEYYLTDLVKIALENQRHVQTIPLDDPAEAIGINNRIHLAEAEKAFQARINVGWMLAGVSLLDPQTTYIEADVQIGADTLILPNTSLQGTTAIGKGCTIGPNSIIVDTRIGDRCTVIASVLEKALLEDDVEIGPFGHLRKGAHLASQVHMGNFGEVKSSYLGPGTKMGHFSYIGDATIGADVNIGAGTITCNFDGERKHPTEIGDHALIGSDTMLVAPVKVGEGARTGAGAVVTHDIPDHTTVVGVPARPIEKKKEKSE